MSRIRFYTRLPAALALMYGASAAFAQSPLVSNPASVTLTYAKGAVSQLLGTISTTVSDSNLAPDGYVVGSSPVLPAWLSVTPTAGSAGLGAPDTCSYQVLPAAGDHMAAGTYNFNVLLQVTGQMDLTVAVTLIVISPLSPLTSSPGYITLTYLKGAGASQSSARVTATITDNDTAADTYTVASGLPAWLTVAPAAGTARISASDTCVFTAASLPSNALAAGNYSYTVHLAVASNPDLTVAVTLHVLAQPLLSSVTSLSLTYVKGGGGAVLTGTASISVPPGSPGTPFTLDVATLPLWLSVTGGAGTATPAGTSVTFTLVNPVAAGLATGNYSANVGLAAAGFPDLLIPISFLVSNAAPSVLLKEGTTEIDLAWPIGSPLPTPTVTPYSTNEPVPVTAACSVVTTNAGYAGSTPCILNGGTANASGVVFTLGSALKVTFDSSLFSALLGTTVKVTVAVTPQGSSAISLTYKYTIQPAAPTITSISPTSSAQIPSGTSAVVLLKGTNFVGPANILPGSGLVPTQFFVGASNSNMTASSVVLSATRMMVTIPQSSFPAYATGKTSTLLALGLANQTGLTAPILPTATTSLNVTNAPVIYGVTSTASYQQPNPGSSPNVAAYELVSIFGDNFGPTGGNIAIAPLDAFSRVGTALTLSGAGATAVTLKVTFKTTGVPPVSFPAPVLFANQNQINAIVPAGMAIGSTVNVTVSSGTGASSPTSDVFPVTVVGADPGIFTLASDGVGQGAIVNQNGSVNQVGREAAAGDVISIYLTGLGAPDSTALDVTANPGGFYAGCVAISNTGLRTPGYLQVVNTAATGYVPPSPAWTSIDGAVLLAPRILGSGLPPCMTAAVSVTFGTGTDAKVASGSGIYYAGFVSGAVAGLYQINAKIPVGVSPGAAVPVMVTLGSNSSSATAVTMAVH